MSRTTLILTLSVSLLSLACGGSDDAPAGAKDSRAEKAGAKGEAKGEAEGGEADKAEGGPKADATAEGGVEPEVEEFAEEGDAEPLEPLPDTFGPIGVALCDQYVTDYVACIDTKVPEDQREAQRRIVFENHSSWTRMKGASPASDKGLQTGCRIAREQAKRATEAWTCAW